MTKAPLIALNNGVKIPALGLGVLGRDRLLDRGRYQFRSFAAQYAKAERGNLHAAV